MPLAFLSGFIALILSVALHALALALFPKLRLLDHPEKYGLKRNRLPYPTGILSVLTFLILFVSLQETLSLQAMGLILAVVLLAAVTLIDDLKNLPPVLRLCIHILVAFILFATGTRIYTITNPLGGIIKLDTIDLSLSATSLPLTPYLSALLGPLPVWSGVFTIVWVLLTTNAFNWFDGIPGQVSILSCLGSLTLGLLALSSRVDQPEIAIIAFILAGCALGGTFFDFPPNRVVMGDTGSMFFGLLLGTLSIYAGGKVATALLVLGVPLMDALLVLFRRILRGESPFSGNHDHLHHRLLAKGWSERQVVSLTIIIGSSFGITALFLSTFQKFLAILILLAVVFLLTWYSRPTDGVPSAPRRR